MEFDFTNYPHDLSANEVQLLLGLEYPTLKRGIDYWVAHQVEQNSSVRTSPAVIIQWTPTVTPPTPEDIANLAIKYAIELSSFQLKEKRFNDYPAKTPLSLENGLFASVNFHAGSRK